jgi:2-phosphosulfolactate phosphatase
VIDVALTRAQLRPADVTVVVDVLRATSTATQALAAGYRRVLCTDSIERAADLRRTGRVLAGERRCVRPDGFDQGNSPIEARRCQGDELVLATTNGAPTIVAAAGSARQVLLGCLLNLAAVIEALLRGGGRADQDTLIVCSGTDGAVALEDAYVAGRLSAALRGRRTDAALVAEGVARAFRIPHDALAASADARVLAAAGLADDIAYCSLESQLDLVPVVVATSAGVAGVAAVGQAAQDRAAAAAVDAIATVKL